MITKLVFGWLLGAAAYLIAAAMIAYRQLPNGRPLQKRRIVQDLVLALLWPVVIAIIVLLAAIDLLRFIVAVIRKPH